MAREEITVEIDRDGNPVIEVSGVSGRGCKSLTADLEQALGVTATSTLKREYNEAEAKHQSRAGQR